MIRKFYQNVFFKDNNEDKCDYYMIEYGMNDMRFLVDFIIEDKISDNFFSIFAFNRRFSKYLQKIIATIILNRIHTWYPSKN